MGIQMICCSINARCLVARGQHVHGCNMYFSVHWKSARSRIWRPSIADRMYVSSLSENDISSKPEELLPRLEQCWSLLNEFTKLDARGLSSRLVSSKDQRATLRDALLTVVQFPWPQANWIPNKDDTGTGILLGVLASDIRLALRSLRDYCEALQVPYELPESRIPEVAALPSIRGPVYIKYNSKSRQCYVTRYQGKDRGVLISFGTVQIGHLPLGLHDESKSKPAPQMD